MNQSRFSPCMQQFAFPQRTPQFGVHTQGAMFYDLCSIYIPRPSSPTLPTNQVPHLPGERLGEEGYQPTCRPKMSGTTRDSECLICGIIKGGIFSPTVERLSPCIMLSGVNHLRFFSLSSKISEGGKWQIAAKLILNEEN